MTTVKIRGGPLEVVVTDKDSTLAEVRKAARLEFQDLVRLYAEVGDKILETVIQADEEEPLGGYQ